MSITRTGTVAYAMLLCVCCAIGMELSSIAPSSSMTIISTQSGRMFALDDIAVHVPAGASNVSLDYVGTDIDPATVALRVLTPDNSEISLERYSRPDLAGKLLWTVRSPRAQSIVLQMRYIPKGISVATNYRAYLNDDWSAMTLIASVSTGNTGKTAYDDVELRLSSGHTFHADLPLGRTISRELFVLNNIPIQRHYVYDEALHGKNVTCVVQWSVPQMTGALPNGPIDFYIQNDIEKRIGVEQLPFSMPGTNCALAVRTAPDLTATGGVVKREQLNVKQDVYKKLALHDLRESYEYTFKNVGNNPAEVIFRAHHSGDWDIEGTEPIHARIDAATAEWTVTVRASGETTLKYSILQKNVTP